MSPASRNRGDSAENILGYWRAIEMFTPSSIPKIDQTSPIRQTYRLEDGLAWGPNAVRRSIRIPKNHQIRHAVYLGIYSIADAYRILDEVFAPDDEGLDSHPAGESACAAFLVDDRGYADLTSLVVSGCAWAVGEVNQFSRHQRSRLNDLDWVDRYEDAAKDFARQADGPLARAASQAGSNDGPVPLTPLTVRALCATLGQTLRLDSGVLSHEEIRIETFTIPVGQTAKDNHDLLNSFYLDDLGKIRTAATNKQIGRGLQQYLSEDDRTNTDRIDVRTELDRVFDAISPRMIPPARWPAPIEQPAALSQQLAVNLARDELVSGAGLFSVNGPPGTGKTTLLRDVVASIVVDRADALARLTRPSDAFAGQVGWRTDGLPRTAYQWIDTLTGHEIVVASSNNAAVENISDEIPDAAVVDPGLVGGLDHFTDIATSLLNRSDVIDESTRDAWALIAARLGNKDNRTKFLTYFFFDSTSNRFRESGASDRLGMNSELKAMPKIPATTWKTAVREYRTSRDRVARILAMRDISAARVLESRELQSSLSAERAELESKASLEHLTEQLNELGTRLAGLNAEHSRSESQLAAHKKRRPRIAARTLHRKAAKAWQTEHTRLQHTVDNALNRTKQVLHEILAAEDNLARVEAILENIRTLEDQIAGLRRQFERDQSRWGKSSADDSWWTDVERRELSSLWLDPECCQARSELFVAAIQLHHHFITHVPQQLRSGLLAVNDILTGTAPPDLSSDRAKAAWQTLFFFVPVVSTTFASFARMFRHLGDEDIGWLLIDEAGQSTPQAAAGAIWRSRRTIVVGDPLQLEPVVTIPFRLQKAISKSFGTSDKWIPTGSSVQALADSTNRWGTLLPQADADIWVGAPLRIHRRCDSPMFDISNAIAYDNMMISAVAARPPMPLPNSTWLDVTGPSRGHLVPAQINRLRRVLDVLANNRIQPDQVFVVSPFRVVAQAIQRVCDPGITAGTVHTAQGKEADVVILVLGGDPNRPGAKTWASKTPNLLNVAVSRAKRRIYVIGDRDAWSAYPFFNVLAAALPAVRPSSVPATKISAGPPDVVKVVNTFSYHSQVRTEQRGRVRDIEIGPVADEAVLPQRLWLYSGSMPIAQMKALFNGQYARVPRRDYDTVRFTHCFDWPTGIPPECRDLLVALADGMAVSTDSTPFLWRLLALDLYTISEEGGYPDTLKRTETGSLVYTAKYQKHGDAGSIEFRELVRRLGRIISFHPAYVAASSIVSVPGSAADGRSFGEKLAVAVAESTGKTLVTTRGTPHRPRKEDPTVDVSGLFHIDSPVSGDCIVIDDVMLSGRTMDQVAHLARRAGARRCVGIVAAKTLRNG